MNNFIKQGLFATVAISLAATSLVLPVGSAHAASNTCWMAILPRSHNSCTTTSVSANPNGHFVHINISPRVAYRVIDSSNGAVVSSGTSGLLGTRKTITGLYSRYHIKAELPGPLSGPNAFATIDNN